jgi:hypothetical protein
MSIIKDFGLVYLGRKSVIADQAAAEAKARKAQQAAGLNSARTASKLVAKLRRGKDV